MSWENEKRMSTDEKESMEAIGARLFINSFGVFSRRQCRIPDDKASSPTLAPIHSAPNGEFPKL